MKISRTNSYNIEIPIDVDDNRSGVWSLYKFDPAEFVNAYLTQYKDFASLNGITTEQTVLKSFEAFASMTLRGVYISNYSFSPSNIPREMTFKVNSGDFAENIYYFDICKGEIKEVEETKRNEEEKVDIPDTVVKKYETHDLAESLNDLSKKTENFKKETASRKQQNIIAETMKKLSRVESVKVDESAIKSEVKNNFELKEMENELLKKNMVNINQEYVDNKKESLLKLFKKDKNKAIPLLPNPIMNLNYLLGYTATHCPKVQFNSDGQYITNIYPNKEIKEDPLKKNIFFTSGSILVKYDNVNLKQTFYTGHSRPITNYLLACKGEILFTSQDGANSIIRVWTVNSGRCLKMLTTPYDKVIVMTESRDSKLLCTVGKERSKDTIIIWDISDLDDIKALIKESKPTPINCLKFSPFDSNCIVSCGKENICFWREKNRCLRNKLVVLDKYSRGTDFLCLDFNSTMFGDESSVDKGKLFVGSNNGRIFYIACNSQELEAVYQVQSSAILSIASNEAFCVTGSEDGYLRIWPIDFNEFIIEAKHDSGVCSVDISYDAIEILCGTRNGSIGKLNVKDKQYNTILRSPPGKINKMIAHPTGNFLFTIENDKSVRVWDVEHKSEAFQFYSTKDTPNCFAAPKTLVFAVGFLSGILKIFDLSKSEILYESKSFQSPISNLLYIQDDKYLISMSDKGNMSIHSTVDGYMQIKILQIDQPAKFTDLSLSIDGDYFASIGPDSNCALVWNSRTFGLKNRVPVNNFFIKRVCLINQHLIGIVLENCCVRFYSLCSHEGIFLKEMMNIHLGNVNQFLVSKNFKFLISGGEEGLIKIWDMKMIFKDLQSFQQFIGHSNAIRSVILLENKSLLVSASENSGIYFWNFLGDITFTETEISQELEKIASPEYMKEFTIKNTPKKMMKSTAGFESSLLGMNKSMMSTKKSKPETSTKEIRIKHMEKAYNSENNPNYEIIKKGNADKEEVPKGNVLKMLPVDEENNSKVSYNNTDFNVTQENISQYEALAQTDDINKKLFFSVKYLPQKIDKFHPPENISNKLKLRYCSGLSINSMHNFVYNEINDEKWYAFTVNNKIIIEVLASERKQIIISDSRDELSCLTISPDGKFLISAIGCVNREEFAAIFVYDTITFKLIKKLNFHFKGVQCVKVSPNGKYMISVGSKEEKSICVWNFTNLTVIDSKSLKFSVSDLVCEYISDFFLYFVTISPNVVSFWRMDNNFKIEGFHINYEDLERERTIGETLASVAITPYYEQIKTSFVLIGTNHGNILVIDKEKKILVKKYGIAKFPLTHLFYKNGTFVTCGEGPLIFNWSFDASKISPNNVFSFLEKEKPNLLFLDGAVVSMEIYGQICLLSTDTGSIFFASLKDKQALKILSSHTNCKITSLETDLNNTVVISCGGDKTLRCWSVDSFDEKCAILNLDNVPENSVLNEKENVLIVQYDSSYLTLYNFNTKKPLGNIRIPQFTINNFALCFSSRAILVTTHQEKMFLIDVQNWDPLSLLYTEVTPNPPQNPKNLYCKSLKCKEVTSEKSYAVLSFSDGTVVTYLIEKINSSIEVTTVDTFNMIKYHMSKTDDDNIKEMYSNLGKYRSDYMSGAEFSSHFDGVTICFHECLQFLFIRNFSKNEIIKSIPLNFFPYSIGMSDDEKYITVGTKEGLVLFITRKEETFNSAFNLDIFKGHYDMVDVVKFNSNTTKLFTSSYSELLVWDIE